MTLMFRFFALPLTFCFLFTACAQKQKEEGKREDIRQTAPVDHSGLTEATFAGGCFWCTEAIFEQLTGVKDVISGYSGGKEKNPSYREVSAGKTGHAESVAIYYNPQEISYRQLLEIFFATHDPTQLNRQGPDVGKQYRSAIFYHNEEQKELAGDFIEKMEQSGKYDKPIVTAVEPFVAFYPAEDYHQDYYRNNPDDPYVVSVTRPKVVKFEKQFKELISPQFQQL